MTETLRTAARNTAQIVDLAERASWMLQGDGRRCNEAGVLASPANMLDDLKAARELIQRAITLHGATGWPAPADYHAL
jgi:hypothetical protein